MPQIRVQLNEYKRVRCKYCHAWICSRRQKPEGWFIHFKKGSWELFADEVVVIVCGKCRSLSKVDPEIGLIDWQKHDPGIQGTNRKTDRRPAQV